LILFDFIVFFQQSQSFTFYKVFNLRWNFRGVRIVSLISRFGKQAARMTSLRMRASLASTLFLLLFAIPGAHAQDFFEELFGGGETHRSAPARARSQGYYRESQTGGAYRAGGSRHRLEIRESRRPDVARSGSSQVSGESRGSEPGAGAGGEFCVRACDGYVFPLIRSAQATKQESCAFACPSASVEYFHGGSIDSARNLRGQRYSELPNAFKYREQTIPGCACHPPEESQQTSLRIARKDPTAQSGDIVVENGGAFVFNGKRIVPIEGSHQVSASIRQDVKRMTEGPAKAGFAAVVAPHPVAAAQPTASPASALIGPSGAPAQDQPSKGTTPAYAVAGLEPVGAGENGSYAGTAILSLVLAGFAAAFTYINRGVLAPLCGRAIERTRKIIAAYGPLAAGTAVSDPPLAWVWSSYQGVIETVSQDAATFETETPAHADGTEAPPLAWVWSAYRGELIADETVAPPPPATARQEAPRKDPPRLYGPQQVAIA
jgi:hypothetical protein